MAAVRTCRVCKQTREWDGLYCPTCGAGFEQSVAGTSEQPEPAPPQPAARRCHECKEAVPEDANACPRCLAQLSSEGLVNLTFPFGDIEVGPDCTLILGRDPIECPQAVAIAAYDNVSRRHAEIRWDAGQVVVQDLGSLNGTFVNDDRIAAMLPRPLRDGDRLRLAADLSGKVRIVGRTRPHGPM